MSKLCKHRRLWRPAVATHPRTTSRLSMSCGFLVQSYILYGADWRSAMGGCVATARRHSLLSLPCLLQFKNPNSIFRQLKPHSHVKIEVQGLFLVYGLQRRTVVEVIAEARLGVDADIVNEVKLYAYSGVY